MQTEFYCHRCDHLPQYCECGEFRTPASPWAFTRRQAPTAEQVTRLQAVATEWAALADLAKRTGDTWLDKVTNEHLGEIEELLGN